MHAGLRKSIFHSYYYHYDIIFLLMVAISSPFPSYLHLRAMPSLRSCVMIRVQVRSTDLHATEGTSDGTQVQCQTHKHSHRNCSNPPVAEPRRVAQLLNELPPISGHAHLSLAPNTSPSTRPLLSIPSSPVLLSCSPSRTSRQGSPPSVCVCVCRSSMSTHDAPPPLRLCVRTASTDCHFSIIANAICPTAIHVHV